MRRQLAPLLATHCLVRHRVGTATPVRLPPGRTKFPQPSYAKRAVKPDQVLRKLRLVRPSSRPQFPRLGAESPIRQVPYRPPVPRDGLTGKRIDLTCSTSCSE